MNSLNGQLRNLEDPNFVDLVVRRLEGEPELMEAWQQYSHDKRGTPSPYLEGTEVGLATVTDGQLQTREVHRYETTFEACAVFIRREALWVLQRSEGR